MDDEGFDPVSGRFLQTPKKGQERMLRGGGVVVVRELPTISPRALSALCVCQDFGGHTMLVTDMSHRQSTKILSDKTEVRQ